MCVRESKAHEKTIPIQPVPSFKLALKVPFCYLPLSLFPVWIMIHTAFVFGRVVIRGKTLLRLSFTPRICITRTRATSKPVSVNSMGIGLLFLCLQLRGPSSNYDSAADNKDIFSSK